MVAYYEKMLVDLEAHHLLDSKLVERDGGDFKVVNARIDDPLAFAQEVMEITAKGAAA